MKEDGKDFKTNRDWVFDLTLQRRARSPAGDPKGLLSQLRAYLTHSVNRERLHRIRDMGIKILVVAGEKDEVVA
ncbi:hypothetical protein HDU93_006600, partial [Gonapodya sp. JEL0774]